MAFCQTYDGTFLFNVSDKFLEQPLILRRSFSDSHIRIEEGGWTRQTTVRELPASKEIAGVNMRLEPGVIRELHWHKEAEWAYVLSGKPGALCKYSRIGH